MSRPLIIDAFCKEGGASMGYHRAGFDVIGIDIEPQDRYPFEFHQGDALDLIPQLIEQYRPAALGGSPPCQAYTSLRNLQGDKEYPDLVVPTREVFRGSGLPYVIENVVGAPLIAPIQLCGSSFGLDVERHRIFELGGFDPGLVPPCAHHWQQPRFRSLDRRQKGLVRVVGVHGHTNYAGEFELRCRAMGIDWMTPRGLTQAIPPAYTQWIGEQLLEALDRGEVAA